MFTIATVHKNKCGETIVTVAAIHTFNTPNDYYLHSPAGLVASIKLNFLLLSKV